MELKPILKNDKKNGKKQKKKRVDQLLIYKAKRRLKIVII
jgi:hypothetical protein